MTGWDDLEAELDAWTAAGRSATFWWRDDDARAPGPALERLVALAGTREIPLALAVVPDGASEALAAFLDEAPHVTVLQHGYAHRNHAGAGEKKIELGPHRPFEHVIAEIATGWARLDSLFASENGHRRLLPVLVPPWNRIAPGLVPMLPELRFAGLSTCDARRRPEPAPGLRQVNSHLDVIDWGTRAFVGEGPALEIAIAHLRARRSGAADPAEPTGLLTHHIALDEDGWRFTGDFLERSAAHPAARWVTAAQAFGMAAS